MKSITKNRWLVGLVLVIAVLALLHTAGGIDFWQRYLSAWVRGTAEPTAALVDPRVVVKGKADNAVPIATPESENLDAQAVAEAIDAAREQGAKALVVHRHGHRVVSWFADGVNGSTYLAGGQLSPAFLVLATGVLADSRQVEYEQAVMAIEALIAQSRDAWRYPGSADARSRFTLAAPPSFLMNDIEGSLANTLSLRIWQPMEAGDAWLWGLDDTKLRLDCCVAARLDDWIRVGDLLLRGGENKGARIVSADWMRHVLAIDENGAAHPIWVTNPGPWSGDEPPAARETYWFDLGPGARLWLLPRRGLSILLWSGAGKDLARDTTIPNIVIRGILDQAIAPGASSNLNDIVPGH